jgi:hypothetical protein
MDRMAKLKRARQARANVSCKSITDLIWKYVSNRLGPKLGLEFEQHLRLCPDCVNFINTYKKTVSLARSMSAKRNSSQGSCQRTNLLAWKNPTLAAISSFFLSFLTG